jgi:hypothetical protein
VLAADAWVQRRRPMMATPRRLPRASEKRIPIVIDEDERAPF